MKQATFDLHKIDGFISTLYLAVYTDKILVLDGGCRNDASRIETYVAKRLNRSMADVKLAVASHTHPDHAGGAQRLRKLFSIPVAAPKHINRWYKGFFGGIQHKVDMLLGYYVATATKTPFENLWYRKKLRFDHALTHGGTLPGFSDWQVIETPGHTSHDVVFYHGESRTLYAADVVLNVAGSYRLPFPVALTEEMRESLDTISTLEVDRLLLAHGGIIYPEEMKSIALELKESLTRGLNPALRRLKYLEHFSTEQKIYKRKRQALGGENPDILFSARNTRDDIQPLPCHP